MYARLVLSFASGKAEGLPRAPTAMARIWCGREAVGVVARDMFVVT
jgi:hypothetical protein